MITLLFPLRFLKHSAEVGIIYLVLGTLPFVLSSGRDKTLSEISAALEKKRSKKTNDRDHKTKKRLSVKKATVRKASSYLKGTPEVSAFKSD